ncbi:hypothetical protein LCM32_03870 [Pseudooceanicola nanhaiensis]|nr:hypothetical protein [Pseudooceanicola nanhaiensis]
MVIDDDAENPTSKGQDQPGEHDVCTRGHAPPGDSAHSDQRQAPPTPEAAALAQARLHAAILARLSCAPLQEDQLIRDLAAPAAQVAPALLDLELADRIERRPGGLLTLVPDPPRN